MNTLFTKLIDRWRSRRIERLICTLENDSRSDENRTAAAVALGKIGAPAVAPLAAVLTHGRPRTTELAATALGKTGDASAVPHLIAALREQYFGLREAAARALAELGRVAEDPLLHALSDQNENLRASAAEILGNIGSTKAANRLVALLNKDGSLVVQIRVHSARETMTRAVVASTTITLPTSAAARMLSISPSDFLIMRWFEQPCLWTIALKLPLRSGALMFATLANLAACRSATPPITNVASGKVFALMDPGESAADLQTYAAMSSVDGLAYRVLWSSLEPSAGSYNWTALDAAFDIVRRQGKKITIHVGPSAGGLPNWLGSLGLVSYTYAGPQGLRTDPVPWDAVYVSRYSQFVAALGAHVQATSNMNLVESVSDPVPVPEMTIVGCQNNQLAGGIAYSRSQYVAAWKTTISAYASAFPGIRLFVSAPLGFICLNDGDGQSVYTELMTYALSLTGNAAVFAADLNALGSQRMQQVGSIAGLASIGLQTIWSYTNDPNNRMQGTLTAAVCRGWNLGARYVEIYQSDLSSAGAGVQAAIGIARSGQGC